MNYRIVLSENARKDLMSIIRYVSEELLEPNTAQNLSRKIMAAIKSLGEFPMRHRLCDEERLKFLGLRVMPVENYLIFYVPDEAKHITKIYRIIYSKRDMEQQLREDMASK